MPVHSLVLALVLGGPTHISVPPRPCGIDSLAAMPARPLAQAACPHVPGPAAFSPTDALRIPLGWIRRLRPAGDPVAPRVVVVRIYDATGLDRLEESRALATAARLLHPSGLRPTWRRCGGGREAHGGCGASPEPGELIVRFMRAKRTTPEAVLGFSYVPGVVGTVLVDRVREFAERSDAVVATLLGATLAHELAHLVAGAPSHAERGLMRASWEDGEVRRAGGPAFTLTPAEREQLSESAGARPGLHD